MEEWRMPDIRIKIAFNDRDSVSVDVVNRVTRDIEWIVYREERKLLGQALTEIGDEINAVTRDAVLYRFGQLRGRSVLIESTDRGSLILLAAVAGLGLWVLQNTLGESFKEACFACHLSRFTLERCGTESFGVSAARMGGAKYFPRMPRAILSDNWSIRVRKNPRKRRSTFEPARCRGFPHRRRNA
jgi:hypothetical protein